MLKVKQYVPPELSSGGICFQPWSGSWWHHCAVVNVSQQEAAVFAVSGLVPVSAGGGTPSPPEILVQNKHGWRGKTNIFLSESFLLQLGNYYSSHEWMSSVSRKRLEPSGSSPCSWLSLGDLVLVLNRWRSHVEKLTKDPTSKFSGLNYIRFTRASPNN